MVKPADKQNHTTKWRLQLIDAAIILIASCTVLVCFLCISRELIGEHLVETMPLLLQLSAMKMFVVIAVGVFLLVALCYLKKRLAGRLSSSNYWLYTCTVVFGSVSLLFAITQQLTAHNNNEPQVSYRKIDKDSVEIKGAFTDANGKDTIVVDEKSNYEDSEYFSSSLRFNDELIFSGERAYMWGICKTKTSQLAILAEQWMGEPTLPSSSIALKFDRVTNKFAKIDISPYGAFSGGEGEQYLPRIADYELVNCQSGQKLLPEQNEVFTPCSCDFEVLDSINRLRAVVHKPLDSPAMINYREVEEALFNHHEFSRNSVSVNEDSVDELISQVERVSKQIVIKTELSNEVVTALSIRFHLGIYSSFDVLLVKKNALNKWYLAYSISSQQKGFHYHRLLKINDDNSVRVEMCTKNCDWWGEGFAIVDIMIDDNKTQYRYVESLAMDDVVERAFL